VSCSDRSRSNHFTPLSSGIVTSAAVGPSSSSGAGAHGGNDLAQAGAGGARSSANSGTGGLAASGGMAPSCIGPTPPQDAWMAMAGPVYGGGGAGGGIPIGTPTIGELPPPWLVPDVQPTSCGFGATYGMDVFTSTVTVAVLLAGW
jgi:hypothetical protein